MEQTLIGVDIGGTKILAAKVNSESILKSERRLLPIDNGDENVVIQLIKDVISELMDGSVEAIGIGIPSIVDAEKGIVYDVQNIPSWKEVHLVNILEEYFQLPVFMNNDANCYALGEAIYGLGKDCNSMVGLTLGTGLGAGIVINGELLSGASGAAGEFGIVPYLDKTIEDYCSGSFIKQRFGSSGEIAFKKAKEGDLDALATFNEFGRHLGNAIKIIISTVDPNKIVIGGSVAQSKLFFEESMWQSVNEYIFKRSKENIQIKFSTSNNMGVFGAASLCEKSSEFEKA